MRNKTISFPHFNMKKNTFKLWLCSIVFMIGSFHAVFAQENASVSGYIFNKSNESLPYANVVLEGTQIAATANESGQFILKNIPAGKYKIWISMLGYEKLSKEIMLKAGENFTMNIYLKSEMGQLKTIVIEAERDQQFMERMPEIQGTNIFSGKKTEVISMDKTNANTAQNSTRQIFSKVPGISTWELDGAGVQVSISSRGLNPHRSWEFNVNQNGFNINSDLFGYPEAHYNPPMEAVQKIEIARGSAALQYGPQFGGMLNYVIKSPDTSKVIGVESQQTSGSFGLFNTFNALGGRKGKWTYYAYFNYRGSNGWRPSSRYDFFATHAALHYQLSKKIKLGIEFSRMNYVIQFGVGLSDNQFNQNPRQSLRNRNYFNPDIMLPAFFMDADINEKTKLSLKLYALSGQRNSVQFISSDPKKPLQKDSINPLTGTYKSRQVDRDYYLSLTSDLRLSRKWMAFNKAQFFSAGMKYSYSNTLRQQRGKGTTGTDFDLSLIDPQYGIDLDFITVNQGIYIENLFQIADRWSVTPGIRFDHIESSMRGDLNSFSLLQKAYDAKRNQLTVGLGSEFKLHKQISAYANYSNAYRPILYADLIPTASTAVVDPNLKDAKGYNVDIGIRGKLTKAIQFDISVFALYYGNRIGNLLLSNTAGTSYLYRTNIGNALTKGLESFIEFHPLNYMQRSHSLDISVFNSLSINNAKYVDGSLSISGKNIDLTNKKVEDVPEYISRSGLSIGNKTFGISLLYSLVGMSYSDANNTVISTADGMVGTVPTYQLFDANILYHFQKKYNVKAGVNNIADSHYFTRRSTGYPGPGIITGDGRSYFISFGFKF